MLKLRIDPWSADYGPSLHLEEEETPEVRLDLEGEWRAHTPPQADLPERVALVDGVRRMDMHLRLEDEVRSFPAAVGTLGVGAIVLTPGRSQPLNQALRHVEIQQLLLVAAPEGPTLADHVTVCTGSDQESLMLTLQQRMRSLEAVVASRTAEEVELVIADGPLQSIHDLNQQEVLGFIKSQHRQLLPADNMDLVRQLQPGQRSPIFRLGSSSYDRLSWYLRLDSPAVGETALAGIVRLEMLASYGLDRARRRADQVGVLLPRLRNSRHRDARSPQNLVPIAVLERALRHRLGDSGLRQRQLRKVLHGGEA
ncbi:hypothetical protein IV102_02900 [bacterium]|nr:hypothetical protein [bacterium]